MGIGPSPGDKVRITKSKETGIVYRRISGDYFEIQICMDSRRFHRKQFKVIKRGPNVSPAGARGRQALKEWHKKNPGLAQARRHEIGMRFKRFNDPELKGHCVQEITFNGKPVRIMVPKHRVY